MKAAFSILLSKRVDFKEGSFGASIVSNPIGDYIVKEAKEDCVVLAEVRSRNLVGTRAGRVGHIVVPYSVCTLRYDV